MFKKKLFTKVDDIICFDTNDPIAAEVKNFYRRYRNSDEDENGDASPQNLKECVVGCFARRWVLLSPKFKTNVGH